MIEHINKPEDIRSFTIGELEQLCKEIREYMIECCATNPGHLGASLGAVELSVALNYVFNTPDDEIVWDVGHQAYAHKIITGRRDSFKKNRMYGGLSGFPKRAESEYDPFGAGHSATSISAALGLAEAARLQNIDKRVIAVIGDGAMTGGLAFEGLNNAGAAKSNILVILNDNQISIDRNVGALHNYLLRLSTSHTYNRIKDSVWDRMGNISIRRHIQKLLRSTKMAIFKNGSVFEGLGFRYFGIIDGNNMGELVSTLQRLKNINGPKLLHINTVKGKGYKPAEENQSLWHAPGKFNVQTGERIKTNETRSKYQDVFGETILELARENEKIVAITPAMVSGCSLTKMMTEMPLRCFDVGIAEQHAVTFAAGLAAGGLLPFCNIYSSFMQRGYDGVIHDAALQNLKVVFCLDRAGLVGEDGATHQGAFDLSYMRCVPNMTIMAPMNERELRNMLYSATKSDYGVTTIRYPRGYGEGAEWKLPFEYVERGKAELVKEGEGIALLSLGTIGNRCAKAIERVEREDNVNIMHYNMRFLKPLDKEAVGRACSKASLLITVEDGALYGGLHSAVSEYVAENAPHCHVIGLGIPDRFIEQGSVDEQLSDCKFNTEDIVMTLKKNDNFCKKNFGG